MTHILDILPQYYKRVENGSKTFEVRKNDRCYQCGDKVVLMEYNSYKNTYSGNKIIADVGFVLSDYQVDGYVTFSLLNVRKPND